MSNLALVWTESPENCNGSRKRRCCLENHRFQGQITVICSDLLFSMDWRRSSNRLCSSERSAWGRLIPRALCCFLMTSSAFCSPLAAFPVTEGCQVPTNIFSCREVGLELGLDVHLLLFLLHPCQPCSSHLVSRCAKGTCNYIAAGKTVTLLLVTLLLDEGFFLCFVLSFFSPNCTISAIGQTAAR